MKELGAAYSTNPPAENELVKHKLSLQNKWHLVVGKHVQVKLKDRIIRAGLAEEVTADDGILWIASDGAECRALFERARDYSVWAQ
jgi:hypothetical protein